MSKTPTRATAKAKAAAHAEKNDLGEMVDSDVLNALAIPATFINTIYPLHRSGIIRLSFGESVDEGTVFHSSIAMNVPVARLLYQALEHVLAQSEEDTSEDA